MNKIASLLILGSISHGMLALYLMHAFRLRRDVFDAIFQITTQRLGQIVYSLSSYMFS